MMDRVVGNVTNNFDVRVNLYSDILFGLTACLFVCLFVILLISCHDANAAAQLLVC